MNAIDIYIKMRNNLNDDREYKQFLKLFPISVEVWIWYLKENNYDFDIFKKALNYCKCSLELWTLYLEKLILNNENEKYILKTFSKAIKNVGKDFHSINFWILYLNFCIKIKKNILELNLIFWNVLKFNIYGINKLIDIYKLFLESLELENINILILELNFDNISKDKNILIELIIDKFLLKIEYFNKENKNKNNFEIEINRDSLEICSVCKDDHDIWINYFKNENLNCTNKLESIKILEKALLYIGLNEEFWIFYFINLKKNNNFEYLLKKMNLYRDLLFNINNKFLLKEIEICELVGIENSKILELYSNLNDNNELIVIHKIHFLNRQNLLSEKNLEDITRKFDNFISNNLNLNIIINEIVNITINKNFAFNYLNNLFSNILNNINEDIMFIYLEFFLHFYPNYDKVIFYKILNKYNNVLQIKSILKINLINKFGNNNKTIEEFNNIFNINI